MMLLDDAERTPEQALAAARVLLAAHTRELSALARRDIDAYRDEHGMNRNTCGLPACSTRGGCSTTTRSLSTTRTPSDGAAWAIVLALVVASGVPLGLWVCRRNPGPPPAATP
ncbi:hypothetical protein ABT255_02160 [Streptomyces mirabilis]|uniref:hypothetical protein n=1 Tax=Streptomyces mirabilis TaxID=68239 RepID=UPI003330FFC2